VIMIVSAEQRLLTLEVMLKVGHNFMCVNFCLKVELLRVFLSAIKIIV
jgi:hypothetical protein